MTRTLLTAEEKRERARIRWRRWADENREHLRETRRAWKRSNPEKVAASNRRYAAAHPEKIREKWQRHQANHPEKCVARTKRYKERHPEKAKAALQAYFATPEGRAARVDAERRRRARKMNCDVVATASEISKILADAVSCHYCGVTFNDETRPTLEHMVPLSRGGAHSIDNLTAACGLCNSRKGKRLPHEFATTVNLEGTGP